jgi:hypothetical protein
MRNVYRYCMLASSILLAASLYGAAQKQDTKWLADAKAYYAKLKLGPLHAVPKDQLTGATTECIAETNATSPVDLACSLPAGSKYYFELMAKNGVNNDQSFNWKACETNPNFMCPGANGSWFGLGELQEDAGRFSVQGRIVPFTSCDGGPCPVRARLKVTYVIP